MNSTNGWKGPSLHRFDSLPLTEDSVKARADYLDAYQLEIAPLVTQRTLLAVDLEIAAHRLQAKRTADAKDATIERLRAELLAVGGEGNLIGSIPGTDSADLAEAQATYDALHAQITNLDTRIEEEDAKLLARFGLS